MAPRLNAAVLTVLAMGLIGVAVIFVFGWWVPPRNWLYLAQHLPAHLVVQTGVGAALLVVLSLAIALGWLPRRTGGILIAAVAAVSAACYVFTRYRIVASGRLDGLKFVLLLLGPYLVALVMGLRMASRKAAYDVRANNQAERVQEHAAAPAGQMEGGREGGQEGGREGGGEGGREAGHRSAWLSPSGAAIAAICFFLPWVKIECLEDAHLSGAKLAEMNSEYWIVFGGEIAILILWLMYRNGALRDPRPYVVSAALASLGLVAFAGFRLMSKAKEFEPRLEFGVFGTVIGLVCALIGVGAMRPYARGAARPPTREPAGLESANCAAAEAEPQGAVFCAACQSPVTADAQFCARCGEKLG